VRGMKNRLLAEILSAHADQLNKERKRGRVYLAMFPDLRNQLKPLLTLAERVKEVLVPVEPSSSFLKDLGKGLITAAYKERIQVVRRRMRKRFIGAAAFGSALSFAGFVAYLIHAHAKRASLS